MGDFRILPEAENDLDDIWHYLAVESASFDIASNAIDSINERIWLIAQRPQIGRRRDHDLRNGLRSFASGQFVILYRLIKDEVFIVRVVRGSREIERLLQE